MSGEEVTEAFIGFSGVYGDRCFAFKNSSARKGFPYLSATTQEQMLRYRPQFRYPERAIKAAKLAEAMSISPGVTPANPDPTISLWMSLPSGAIVVVDDPALIGMFFVKDCGEKSPHARAFRVPQAFTGLSPGFVNQRCKPSSRSPSKPELGIPLDKRRSNIYFNLPQVNGFAEDELAGRKLRTGSRAEIMFWNETAAR